MSGQVAGRAAVKGQESARRREARRLDAAILAALGRGWEDPLREDEIDALARRLFLHQRRHNPVLAGWWRDVEPRAVRGWRDVPPLPVAAWKRAVVAAFPADPEAITFLSSGTTAAARSRVFVESLDLYEAAVPAPFRRHALDEGVRLRLLFLFPPPHEVPQSSLGHMFEVLRHEIGSPGSAFLRDDPAHVCAALAEAASCGEPLFLLGPAFAFVHLLDHLRARGTRLSLPPGSRLFQTGGFKGRSRAIEPAELTKAYAEQLALPHDRIVNEYGMAELTSQFYAGPDGRYAGPPWVRWRVLDPLTLAPVAEGVPGVLAVWDLANRSSCFAVRTEDLAVRRQDRFELLGRLPGAEPRGCSLTVDSPEQTPSHAAAR